MFDTIKSMYEYIIARISQSIRGPFNAEVDSKFVKPTATYADKAVKRKTTNKKKLDCKIIIWCRDQFKMGVSVSDLASKMGVGTSTMSRAMSGKTYKDCAKKM
jgi:hypothetical protein